MGGPRPALSDRGTGADGAAEDRTSPRGQVQLAVRRALVALRAAPRTDDAPDESPDDGPWGPRGAVVVATSGGADSLALLAATVHVAVGLRLRVHAVCVDHGWHPRTRAVAVAVARAAAALGADDVRVVGVRPRRSASGAWAGGPEDAARTARLAALAGVARRDRALAVLLGHTLDDQAEQVLLGLARGSGARALAGMPAAREPFLRPLLGLRRDVVRAACPDLPALGLPWQDPANTDEAYLRARVRADVVPVLVDVLGPGAVTSLARSADLLRADDDALRAWAEREVDALVGPLTPGPADAGRPVGVDVAVEPLQALPPAVRTRALRLLAERAGARALTRRHTTALDALVVGRRGQGPLALPGSVAAQRTAGPGGCGRLRLTPSQPSRKDPDGRP